MSESGLMLKFPAGLRKNKLQLTGTAMILEAHFDSSLLSQAVAFGVVPEDPPIELGTKFMPV